MHVILCSCTCFCKVPSCTYAPVRGHARVQKKYRGTVASRHKNPSTRGKAELTLCCSQSPPACHRLHRTSYTRERSCVLASPHSRRTATERLRARSAPASTAPACRRALSPTAHLHPHSDMRAHAQIRTAQAPHPPKHHDKHPLRVPALAIRLSSSASEETSWTAMRSGGDATRRAAGERAAAGRPLSGIEGQKARATAGNARRAKTRAAIAWSESRNAFM